MRLLNLTQVARLLGLSYPTAKKAFDGGQLPDPVIIGSKPKFRESEILAMIGGRDEQRDEGAGS